MRALATALLLTLAGCGLLVDDGTFRVGDVTVVDEAGLVTAVAGENATERILGETPRVERGESLRQLDVLWMGPACVEGWAIRLTGNALLVTIQPTEGSMQCGLPSVAHSVRLTLNRVVDAEAVEVQLFEVRDS